MLPFFMHFC